MAKEETQIIKWNIVKGMNGDTRENINKNTKRKFKFKQITNVKQKVCLHLIAWESVCAALASNLIWMNSCTNRFSATQIFICYLDCQAKFHQKKNMI